MAASSSGKCDYTREDIDYDSTNEDDEDTRAARKARCDLADKPKKDKRGKAKAHRSEFNEGVAADEGHRQRVQFLKLNAYDRHRQLINTYQVIRLTRLSTEAENWTRSRQGRITD